MDAAGRIDGDHERVGAGRAEQDRFARHDQRVGLLGRDDAEPSEHARAQLAAVVFGLDPDCRRAALGVYRGRDRADRAGEGLRRKCGDLKLDRLALGDLSELALFDVDDQLEGRPDQHRQWRLRADEGARRDQSFGNDAVHRGGHRRLFQTEGRDVELRLSLVDRGLRGGHVVVGVRALGLIELRLRLGDRLLLAGEVVARVRRLGFLELLPCLVDARLGLLDVLVGWAAQGDVELGLITLESLV